MTYKITETIEVDGQIMLTADVEGRGEIVVIFPAEYAFDRDSIVQRAIAERIRLDEEKANAEL